MEATKERAARRDRATPARTSGSSPAHGSRTQSITRRRRRAKARIRQAAVFLAAAAIVAGVTMLVSSIATDRPETADTQTPSVEQPAVVVTAPAASTQTPEPTEAPARFYLSASERDVVERVVMAESGGESYEGQMLVAQCILNGAEKQGVQPSEAVEIYQYAGARPKPTQSVKDAVAAVFDRGETVVDEPVLYFYNPAIVETKGRFELPGKRPDDLIACAKVGNQNLTHPNEKPVELLEQLIEATTTPGALILDPFAGSGSTLVAAAKTGRKYIGIEIDEHYSHLAATRAAEYQKGETA